MALTLRQEKVKVEELIMNLPWATYKINTYSVFMEKKR